MEQQTQWIKIWANDIRKQASDIGYGKVKQDGNVGLKLDKRLHGWNFQAWLDSPEVAMKMQAEKVYKLLAFIKDERSGKNKRVEVGVAKLAKEDRCVLIFTGEPFQAQLWDGSFTLELVEWQRSASGYATQQATQTPSASKMIGNNSDSFEFEEIPF